MREIIPPKETITFHDGKPLYAVASDPPFVLYYKNKVSPKNAFEIIDRHKNLEPREGFVCLGEYAVQRER